MKLTLLFAMAMLFTHGSVMAKDSDPSMKDPKKQEMMQKWKEFSTPGAPHKVFDSMVGKWKYTSKWWETADAKPEESNGTSTLKLILGGRFLEHQTKGKSMGMPFEGLGITGYDNLKGKYETLWLDNMGTGIMHGTGSFDANTQTLSDSGEASCPMTDSKTRPFRSDWKIIDKNNMVYTMFAPGTDGKEFKQMELIFKRVK